MSGKRKIVYFLGAGFSKPAGAPSQDSILSGILSLDTDSSKLVGDFLMDLFHHTGNIPLEDIFTALDRSIARDESLGVLNLQKLIDIRDAFIHSLGELYFQKLEDPKSEYVSRFADILLNLRYEHSDSDQIAIISTNWDLLIDHSLGSKLATEKRYHKNGKRTGFVDYCVSDQPLKPDNDIPRSINIKAMGLVNFKLLKLHGSFNWLLCPSCDGLFVEFEKKVAYRIKYNPTLCSRCLTNHHKKVTLRSYIVSPTYLKDLNSVHSKMCWWNAAHELSEATHVVFIGYSLPPSDYEIRYHLTRYIRANAKIKVVLWDKNPRTPNQAHRAEAERYQGLFGPRRLVDRDISFGGVVNYVQSLSKGSDQIFW